MTNKNEQQREHFRLVYPLDERPALTLGNKTFAVVDVSESGIRFAGGREKYTVGVAVKGDIVFPDNARCAIVGKVTRVVDGSDYIIRLDTPIPLARMMSEQRRLIQKYKAGA